MFSRQENNRPRLSLFEIVVSVILLLILLLVAQPFFSKMLENFERTALQQIVRQLNAAAYFKMAEYVALDKLQQLPEQLDENPVYWLDIDDLEGWEQYLGEVDSVNFEQLEEQIWVYDKSTNRLIYKVKYPYLLDNEDPVSNRIQFRVEMDYMDYNRDKRFDADTDTISGLMIVAVYPYRWLQPNNE